MRYTFDPSRAERFEVTLSATVTADILDATSPETAIPDARFLLQLESRGLDPSGALQVAFRLESYEILEETKAPPEVSSNLRRELGTLDGFAGTATIDTRGLVHAMTSSVRSGQPPSDTLRQLRHMLHELPVPMPEEPIGTGAHWEKVTAVDSRTAKLTQKETYTLTGQNAERISVRATLVESAPEQPAGGVLGRAAAMSGSGGESVSFDLVHVVPEKTADTNATFTIVVGGQQMTSTMRARTVTRPIH
jgi:hypothetical protein